MCAAQKQLEIVNRIILYYKYDSYPVDCVKTFISTGRNIIFRFLLVCFTAAYARNTVQNDAIFVPPTL